MTRTTALVPFVPPLSGALNTGRRPAARKSAAHRLALVLVLLAVASSGIVFAEPAPVDVLNLALMIGLPLVGLVAWRRMLFAYLGLWLSIAAAGFLAATMADDTTRAISHFAISLYLYVTAFVVAGFVARSPVAHTRLILDGYLVAAALTALAGLAGTFDLVPGAADLFTRHGRASGTFKDPNVFGAFLVPALLYAGHLWLERPLRRALPMSLLVGLLATALLLSFSRGAWVATVVGLATYWALSLLAACTHRRRLALLGLPVLVALVAGGLVAAALQDEGIARLAGERTALTQSYDEGAEGRFGGQWSALGLIAESPFGVGALEFSPAFHPNGMMVPNRSEGRGFGDDVHNSYLSMFLNGGWLAGALNIVAVALTLAMGARHALRRTASRPLFIVAFSAVAGILAEGTVIDFDHWRHAHLLLALVWGLMAGDPGTVRGPRIVADRRPLLRRPRLLIPPSRRGARLVNEIVRRPPLTGLPAAHRRIGGPRRRPRIAARA